MARIDRATAIEQAGVQAVEILDDVIPQPTAAPQANVSIVEFAALTPNGDGWLKAFYYQEVAALAIVDNDLTQLHWCVRDYEVLA